MSGEAPGPMRVALEWIAHPVSVIALVVLVVNDHVLKAAFGNWWTGKLSDVAGLTFFPALVAVALAGAARLVGGRGAPRLDLAALAITGAGFVWVKATWAGAAAASAALTAVTGPLFGGPSIVRADASDLLALPALGLAAWVAAGSSRDVRGGATRCAATRTESARGWASRVDWRLRARKALGVALVPVAILASVATGPGARPEASVVEDGTGGWVVVAGGCEDATCWGLTAYRLTDHGWVSEGETRLSRARVTLACSEVLPDECFRTVPGKMAVEQSHDGGATWKRAWAASAEDLRALRDAYGTLGTGQEGHLQSSGVGVFDGADGMTVVVANRVDGLVMRGPDGHWGRVAFEGLSCCDHWRLVPLPTRWMPYGAEVPPAVAWGTAALLLSGTITLLLADRRVTRENDGAVTSRKRWAWGWTLGACAAAALAAIVTGPLGESNPAQTYSGSYLGATAVLLVPAALVLAAVAFGVAGGGNRRVWWRMGLLGLAVAVVVGAAVFAVPGADWWDLLVATVVGVACVWIAGRVVASRGEEWGFTPLIDPPPRPTPNPLGSNAVVPNATVLDDSSAAAEWTWDDALVLRCVGTRWASTSLQWVLAEADYLDRSYPSVAQLEVSLGRLEASGLVKVVRPGWFKATRAGRAILRKGRRRVASPGLNEPDPTLAALVEVPCVKGRVRIGKEGYDAAIRRYLGH